MNDMTDEITALAQHMAARREDILLSWRRAVRRDPTINSGDSLPRVEVYDHLPALLKTFERQLLASASDKAPVPEAASEHAALQDAASQQAATQQHAAAHGLQRWQQGYDLRDVTRELGKLNEAVVDELDAYIQQNPAVSHPTISAARRLWAGLCSAGIEESVAQYFQLQQQEAAGQLFELETTLSEVRETEQQRAELWRQAAHDLRGNLGVVANATVGLTHGNLRESARDGFVRILLRNVTSLHHLLDDVTSLARLQAGQEQRSVEPIDVAQIVQQLCEGFRPLAQQRRLFLRCEGPQGYAADGDAVKLRRIAQNLILNAIKYTNEGGITVSWGDCAGGDTKRWELRVIDTGPGLPSPAGAPLTGILAASPDDAVPAAQVPDARPPAHAPPSGASRATQENAGEGIGLSIVKRLCDILDAKMEVQTKARVGTTFHIRFPRHYA